MASRLGRAFDFKLLRPLRRFARQIHLRYFGGIPEGTYERYGLQGTPISYYTADSQQWILLGAAIFLGYASLAESRFSEDLLTNLEINRSKFYKQSFGVQYMDTSTKALYDGPTGYTQIDPKTGIKKDLDGRLQAPPDDELRANLARIEITPDMVDRVKELRLQQLAPKGSPASHAKDETRVGVGAIKG